MKKVIVLCCVVGAMAVAAACEKSSPPETVTLSYVVRLRGVASPQIAFSGEFGKDVIGYCSMADSGDPAYPRKVTFKLSRTDGTKKDEISVTGLKVKENPGAEILRCDSSKFSHDSVSSRSVACADVDEGGCEFVVVTYDTKLKRIEGTFACGDMQTDAFDDQGVVLMSISGGTFAFENCS